ncbi:hypothetical protein MHU86_5384 [Fragilaria crotonensis]|nr:hypothetical protein MHU86_5384 [Fragilaria crotonensis]
MAEATVKLEAGAGAPKGSRERGDSKKKGYHFAEGQNGVVLSNKVKGKCQDLLKGSIYDCSADAKEADIFVKTTKNLAAYLGRTMKLGGDMRIIARLKHLNHQHSPFPTIHQKMPTWQL